MGLKYNKRMSIVAAFCIDSIWQCLNSMLDVLKHKHMIVPFLGKPFHKHGFVFAKRIYKRQIKFLFTCLRD